MFDKVNFKFILNHQIDIFIIINYNYDKSNNNESCGVVKEIVKVIKANEYKKIKWRYELKNKLIIFTYYLKLFFIGNHNYFIKHI